jgi:uncharacterized cupredoxin-like copper-binding protein
MHRPIVAACIVVIAGALSACSPKDGGKPDSSKVAQSGATSPSLASFDPVMHVAVIHAKDFSFDAPDSITAGLTSFHFVNDGPNLHHVQLARLDSGKTMADFVAATKTPGPTPKWVVFTGGPNAASPGSATDATVILEPGNYVVLCFVDTPDKVPHFAKGMLRPLKVVRNPGPKMPEPAADITVGLSDYAFGVQGGLVAGKHMIKVTNTATQTHEIAVVRLAPGKSLKEAAEFLYKPVGPPPMDIIGGVSGMDAGTIAYFPADFTPGNYAFVCFVPDSKDGKPHTEHGMVKEFTVK